MRRQGSGRIIFISSVAGWTGVGGGGPYSASKFALEGLLIWKWQFAPSHPVERSKH
jgi:NAD(P)-dependent dehydrogenase (short-subunit alcohol dehydrogenase family)